MGQREAKLDYNNTFFDYGTHETAVCKCNNVAELEEQSEECKKDHDNYIPIEDLKVEDFPETYREQDVYDLTKSMAALTVRIKVDYCSKKRRKFWMETDTKYPGYKQRGRYTLLIGSGRICHVTQKEEEKATCPCRKCKEENSKSSAEREVWTIWVYTAMHVVYDSKEAAQSNCRLFYAMQDGSKRDFYGVKKLWSNVNGDLCMLSCVTCDKELVDTIHNTIKTFNILWRRIRENYKKDKVKSEDEKKYKNRIVIIVSHPHGWPKKVSFGHLVETFPKTLNTGDEGKHLCYKANTCAGSSGAPVYLFGQDWFKTEFVHSGCNNEINYSTTWCPQK